MDSIDRLIRARLRDPYASTNRADVEHSPSICHNVAVTYLSTGMKNLETLDCGSRVETFDRGTLGIVAGITLRRHHHGKSSVRIPTQIKVAEHAVATRKQRRHQIRHQPQHDHLALGITEAHVV